MRPRLGLWLGLLALAMAAVIGGYALGASRAPDARDAQLEREQAARSAFAAAHEARFRDGLRRGRSDGIAAGHAAGRREAERQGRAAGEAAIKDALVRTKGRRSTTEAEAEPDNVAGGAGSGEVLVVGDSLEVLTSPYLRRYLPSVPLTINAEGGYSSIQIFELFEQSYDPSHSVVVFDAGTNDSPLHPEILAGRLQAVAQAIGDRCMVVPTIHGLSVDGVDSDAKNRVVRAFAASRPGTQVPDWARVVATHPELMQPDNLHPLPEGAAYRARLIARGVKACLRLSFPSASRLGG